MPYPSAVDVAARPLAPACRLSRPRCCAFGGQPCPTLLLVALLAHDANFLACHYRCASPDFGRKIRPIRRFSGGGFLRYPAAIVAVRVKFGKGDPPVGALGWAANRGLRRWGE
jgi:hypothetical protein